MFNNGSGDIGVNAQTESYQKLKNCDASLLYTQYYKIRIKDKVEQSREIFSAFPYTSVL